MEVLVMAKDIVAVVYDPPKAGLPYLSVIIVPGLEDNPTVTPFPTAAQAEAFNLRMANAIVEQRQMGNR